MQQQISIIGMMWFRNCEGLCIWRSSDLSYMFPKGIFVEYIKDFDPSNGALTGLQECPAVLESAT